MQYLLNENNAKIVQEIVTAIHANANLLSQIDGEMVLRQEKGLIK